MGKGAFRIPGPLGTTFNLGNPKLKKPAILDDPKLEPLKQKAEEAWDQVVRFVDRARLKAMLNEIYGSERWADANKEDKGGKLSDPMNARLPHTTREQDARRPTEKPTLRLKDPDLSFKDGILHGTASFVLEIPTPYPEKFDSPTSIRVEIKSPKVGLDKLSVKSRVTVLGGLVRVNFNKIELHYDPRAVVKAAVAIARDRGIKKETLEELLSEVRIDVSAFGWVAILPTWVWLSASSALPLDRPLLGTKDRLLPVQFGALPDSSFVNVGTIAVPSGVFFDTPAPAAGAHWSKFGRDQGFSLTASVIGTPNLDQIAKDWSRAASVYGYADLYYVKRVSDTVDLGVGLTYAIDVFGERAAPTPAHLHYLESKYKPWLPPSQENVPPAEDRSGQRLMFRLKGTHDLLGG